MNRLAVKLESRSPRDLPIADRRHTCWRAGFMTGVSFADAQRFARLHPGERVRQDRRRFCRACRSAA